MSSTRKGLPAFAWGAGAAFSLVSFAQAANACPNWSAQPTFGEVRLSAGFVPDPHPMNLVAGGGVNLSSCIAGS